MGGRGATPAPAHDPAPASAPAPDHLDEEGPGNAHALDEGDWLLPPDDSGSDDTNSSNCSDLPSAPLRERLPSTAAPMLDRSDCELPDEELEEAEKEAEENVEEEAVQRRTLKAPSMAAPTLDVTNVPDVPGGVTVQPPDRVEGRSKRVFSSRVKNDDGEVYYQDWRDPDCVTTCWDDPEPGVSSGSSDTTDSASDDSEEQPLPSEQPDGVSWNHESIQATRELIDRIDMMAAAGDEAGGRESRAAGGGREGGGKYEDGEVEV